MERSLGRGMVITILCILALSSPISGQQGAFDPEARLAELGIQLPEPPSPVANYVNGVQTGNLIFLAGKGPRRADGSEIHGKLGADLTAFMVFADVDGDEDAVLANGPHWAQVNGVYLNNGQGRFTLGYPLGPERATTYAVPVGDLDGDGDLDVVVANDMAESWVSLNDGQGRFQRAWEVGPEIEPTGPPSFSTWTGT